MQLNPGDPPTALQGTNFQKMYGVDYSGEVSTQQGTTALTVLFIELLEPLDRIVGVRVRTPRRATTH